MHRQRGIVAVFVVLYCVAGLGRAQEAPPSFSTESHRRLKERDRWAQETTKLRQQQKLPEAIEACQKMLQIEREVLGDNDIDVIGSLIQLAEMHEACDDFAAAKSEREEILATTTQLEGAGHWKVIDARLALEDVERWAALNSDQRHRLREADKWMGEVEARSGEARYAEALARAEQALRARSAILGDVHRLTAHALGWVAYLRNELGNMPAAEAAYLESLEINKQVLSEAHPFYLTGMGNVGLFYKLAGNGPRAKEFYRRALDLQIKIHGPDHWQAIDARLALEDVDRWLNLSPDERVQLKDATAQINKAAKQARESKYAEAIALVEGALATRRPILGDSDRDTAQAWGWLGYLRNEAGDTAGAKAADAEALAINKRVLGDGHPIYLTCLSNLAMVCKADGDYARAESLLREALATTNKILGEGSVEYATRLDNLGQVRQARGDYREAAQLMNSALETRRRLLGASHQDYAKTLNNLAAICDDQGDYRQAETLYREALEVDRQALGENHPSFATAQMNLAVCLKDQEQYAEAEPLMRAALETYKAALGESHPLYATCLDNLGALYKDQDDFARAEPLLRKAAGIKRLALGAAHPDYAAALSNLASLFRRRGETAQAETLYRQVLEIRRKALGEMHPVYAVGLSNLALVYTERGDDARAEPLMRQALDIKRKAFGEMHPHFATSLNKLAALYSRQGDYARAEPLYRQALEIRKSILGESHPEYAISLDHLASLYQAQGDYARAEPYYLQLVDLSRRRFGSSHPDYALRVDGLARLYRAAGNDALAELHAKEFLRIVFDAMESLTEIRSEQEQLIVVETISRYLGNYLSIAAASGSSAARSYAEVLAWKNFGFSQQRTSRLARRPDNEPAVRNLSQELTQSEHQLADLIRNARDNKDASIYRGRFEAASERVKRLRREMAAASTRFSRRFAPRWRTPDDVRRALPPGVVLVDFIEYWHVEPPKAPKESGAEERRLAAFVVRCDTPIVRVELGPVAPIAEAVKQWRLRFTAATRNERIEQAKAIMDELIANPFNRFGKMLVATSETEAPDAAIKRRVWTPIANHLADATTVLISPDGPLSCLPWGALPGKTEGTYLIEDVSLSIVPEPQLLPDMLAGDSGRREMASLLLVGQVDYEAAPGLADTASRPAARGRAPWPPLDSTRIEIEDIRRMFEHSFVDGECHRPLWQKDATEAAVRQAAAFTRYLHLATHGFFAADEVSDGHAPVPGSNFAQAPTNASAVPSGLLSGVVLAGCNRPAHDGEDDGILTALEIEDLDLRGVELVTLSACQTAPGAPHRGEGVLALQRAFQASGARTAVVSFWKTPDETTRALLSDFYEKVWTKKMAPSAALREAQLQMLRSGAARLSKLDDHYPAQAGRLPPYYWANFVLSGGWR
ncbi:MAG TPA: tetratricopeptide repeat protein [Pirellulales bacterium]|nr:tetratricopeptide repeat protein [Pirellulales bacterium]